MLWSSTKSKPVDRWPRNDPWSSFCPPFAWTGLFRKGALNYMLVHPVKLLAKKDSKTVLFIRRKHYSFLQSWRKGYRFPTDYYVRAGPLDEKFMAKLVRFQNSTKLSIQAPFFYTKGQREVEAQHPVVGMDTGLAPTYMDFKITSDLTLVTRFLTLFFFFRVRATHLHA